MEYVMFMLGGGDYTATRAVGEKALTAVGTHVAEGLLVWQVVLLVEKQVKLMLYYVVYQREFFSTGNEM